MRHPDSNRGSTPRVSGPTAGKDRPKKNKVTRISFFRGRGTGITFREGPSPGNKLSIHWYYMAIGVGVLRGKI